FITLAHSGSETDRGIPHRSLVMMTHRFPAASTIARALTHKSWRLVSHGLLRLAYPAIQRGSDGVMTLDAVPALKPSAEPGRTTTTATNADKRKRMSHSGSLALRSFAIALSRIASLSGPARATVGS